MAFENVYTSDQLRGDINVTPLIDVLLVLLIIFMLIAPIVPYGLNAALPQRSMSAIPKPETPIVVQITSAGDGLLDYKINQQKVSIDELGNQLKAIFSARGDKVMFVKGDNNLDFSAVARIIDIGRGAGADRIGLLTSKNAL